VYVILFAFAGPGALPIIFTDSRMVLFAVFCYITLGAFLALIEMPVCHPRMAIELIQWLFFIAFEAGLGFNH